MNKRVREQTDAFVAEALKRLEKGVGEPEARPKPVYRLMGSHAAGESGQGAKDRGGRIGRSDVSFAFALTLFALVTVVPAVASLGKPGFAEVAGENIVNSEELSEYGNALARGAALLGNYSGAKAPLRTNP